MKLSPGERAADGADDEDDDADKVDADEADHRVHTRCGSLQNSTLWT